MIRRLFVTFFVSSVVLIGVFHLLSREPMTAVVATSPSSLPIVVVADMHTCQHTNTQQYKGYVPLLEHVYSRLKSHEIKAILTAGDNLQNNETLCPGVDGSSFTSKWTHLLNIMSNTGNITTTGVYTVVFVPGNHEHLQDGGEAYSAWMSLVEPYQPQSTCPVAGCGSFDVDQMHIAFLNIAKSSASEIQNYQGQKNWLKQDLQNTQKPFKIVVIHYPSWGADASTTSAWWRIDGFKSAYTASSQWQVETQVKLDLHQVFTETGVRLVINGHRHAYNAFVKDGVYYITAPSASNGSEFSVHHPVTDGLQLFESEAYTATAKQGAGFEQRPRQPDAAIAKQGYLEIQPHDTISPSTEPRSLTIVVKDYTGNRWPTTLAPTITILYPPVAGVDAASERADLEIVDFFAGGYRYKWDNTEKAFYATPLCAIWGTYNPRPPLDGIDAVYQKGSTRYFFAGGTQYTLTTTFVPGLLSILWGGKPNSPPTTGIDAAFFSTSTDKLYIFAPYNGYPGRYVQLSNGNFDSPSKLSVLWHGSGGLTPTVAGQSDKIDAVWRKYPNTYFYQKGTRYTLVDSAFVATHSLESIWGLKPVNPDPICFNDPNRCSTYCPEW